MKAIILAAGYATRLYPVTKHYPKPLLKIGGKTIMDSIVDDINTIPEIDKIYVITNDKMYKYFEAWHQSRIDGNKIVVYNDGTDENGIRLGAIGDILFTVEKGGIDEDVLIVAGDTFYTCRLREFYDYFKNIGKDCACVKAINDYEELKRFGIAETDENNCIIGMEEKPQEPKSNLVVFATYMYTRETMKLFDRYLKEGNAPDAPGNFLKWLYKIKPVYAWEMTGECYDIGTNKEYVRVRKLFS